MSGSSAVFHALNGPSELVNNIKTRIKMNVFSGSEKIQMWFQDEKAKNETENRSSLIEAVF